MDNPDSSHDSDPTRHTVFAHRKPSVLASATAEASAARRPWLRAAASAPVAAIVLLAGVAHAAVFTVTNINTSGSGSLAKAITDANATEIADEVRFAIGGQGVRSINAPFPVITQPLFINGYSQADARPNTAIDKTFNGFVAIRLAGGLLALGSAVLEIAAEDTTILGLAVNGIPAKGFGIKVDAGIDDVRIGGCLLGVDPNGSSDATLGNGLLLDGSAVVGTADPADRNIISGNDAAGIVLRGFSSVIQNNLIGLNQDGEALANGIGIQATTADARDSLIGGREANQGNVIAGNTKEGVLLSSTAGDGIRIEGNRIHDNGKLGIDINGDGPTFNDRFDVEPGPNNEQNFPEIAFVRLRGLKLEIEGVLTSGPGTYRMEFFRAQSPDPSGFGEGETFLGALTTSIPGDQRSARISASFNLSGLPTGTVFVTATAQRVQDESTSEFSRAVAAEAAGVELVVTTSADSGIGSLRSAIAAANASNISHRIVFNIFGDGPHVLQPASGYVVNNRVIIDGFTEEGALPNTQVRGSDADMRIVIDGGGIGGDDAIFDIAGDDVTIRGLVIQSSASAGIVISTNAEDARIEGNSIGTDVTGTLDFGNNGAGIDTGSGVDTLIGGFAPGNRNVISGNGAEGVVDRGVRTTIVGNIVGGDSTGEGLVGNDGNGIRLSGVETVVGSDELLRTNQIVGNGGAGIAVSDDSSGLELLGNDIDANVGLGIDLLEMGGVSGVTGNDGDDIDPGANNRQNFPEVAAVSGSSTFLQIEGELDVPADRIGSVYRIRVFASPDCDASGNGEGAVFLVALNVAIPADETFLFQFPASVDEGSQITLTATDPETGDTSEFSECAQFGEADVICGDATGDFALSAADALVALKAAVGSDDCELCNCDVNNSTSITSGDALLILRASVGQDVDLDCPPCQF